MTLIQSPQGAWRVIGTGGQREFPQCQCRSDLMTLLSMELFGDNARSTRDVTWAVMHSAWDAAGRRWVPGADAPPRP